MGRIIKFPYGLEVVIKHPIVLHNGQIVERQELMSLLEQIQAFNSRAGFYVYRDGHDYPSSKGFTWHYCYTGYKYLMNFKEEKLRICATKTGWRAEPVQEEEKQ